LELVGGERALDPRPGHLLGAALDELGALGVGDLLLRDLGLHRIARGRGAGLLELEIGQVIEQLLALLARGTVVAAGREPDRQHHSLHDRIVTRRASILRWTSLGGWSEDARSSSSAAALRS